MDQYVGEAMNTIIATEVSEGEKSIVVVTHDELYLMHMTGNDAFGKKDKIMLFTQRKRAIYYDIPMFRSVS